MGRPMRDLTGQVINGIKVLRMAECERGAGHHIRWICECPLCHNEYEIKSSHLKQGASSKCKKCANKLANPPHSPSKYFVGAKFGCWTIIAPTNHINAWKVQCECGKQFCPKTPRLLRAPSSCNCFIKSKGEQIIYSWLKENNIVFEMQKTFPTCKPRNRVLMFDFYLPTFNLIIEFDGIQHFSPNHFMGGEERFQKTIENDRYKDNWAKENEIKLLRIAYTEDIIKRLSEEIVRLTENKEL